MSSEPLSSAEHSIDLSRTAAAFVPLGSLKASYLDHLLINASVDHFCAGHRLLDRGVCDSRHVYLLQGRVELQFASGYTEFVSANETLHPLANEMPRPCNVVADSDVTILILDSDHLDQALSWSQIADYVLSELSVERDLDEDIGWIKTVVNSNLFLKVPPVNVKGILKPMTSEVVIAGDVILREGEIGNCCYFIKEGRASVSRRDESAVDVHLADIGAGRCFGEDALVYETLRNATVTMLSDGVLMRLNKADFKCLLVEPEVAEFAEDSACANNATPIYVDVRTQGEYEEGHLALSINIPLSLLGMKQRLLNKNMPYVFYCNTGRRSRAAAYFLGQQGFNAMALKGGLIGAGMQYQLVNGCSYMLKNGVIVEG